MDEATKCGAVGNMAMGDVDMAKINAQTLKELPPHALYDSLNYASLAEWPELSRIRAGQKGKGGESDG